MNMPEIKRLNRLLALMRKESLQIVRDPAAILIAFILPVVMLFLFAYAVSLDIRKISIAVVETSDTASAQSLAAAFSGTRYFNVLPMRNTQQAHAAVISGKIWGYVVIPADFDRRLGSSLDEPLIQVITDGTQPNTANFVAAYAESIAIQWLASRGHVQPARIGIEQRVWFNPELESKRFLVPGAIAIIMTMIGTMLTSLVVVREWERGTMEALLSTPARISEILIGKLLPYFLLGLIATLGSAVLAVFVFDVPLRGSWLSLLLLASVFLIPALAQGMVISVVAKNQFVAGQIAAFAGFLPAFILSGFLFEIDAMPLPLQLLSYIIPARYFVSSLQTVFLAGDIWSLMLPNMLAMLLIGLFFFAVARAKTHKTLDR